MVCSASSGWCAMTGFWWALGLVAVLVFWLACKLGAALDDVLPADQPLRKPD